MSEDAELSIVCLGTGKGASMVYDGCCSSSYVLCVNSKPMILFGAGYGVARQCLRYFGVIPLNIVIFSNRSHMSAELPVILDVESHRGRCLNIITNEVVMSRLQEHRLAETRARFDLNESGASSVCNFVALRDPNAPRTSRPLRFPLSDVPFLSLSLFSVPATEPSCGAVVYRGDSPAAALTGDCAYDAARHREILSMAPFVFIGGRAKRSADHAAFGDIARAAAACAVRPRRVFVGQYGKPSEAPPPIGSAAVAPIAEGAVVALRGERFAVADAAVHCARGRGQRGEGGPMECQPKKVFFQAHDDPEAPPTLIMVQQFRTLAQVKQRVSAVLHLRPLGDFFSSETGEKIKSISQFEHGKSVVVTRIGGRPFEQLPLKSTGGRSNEESSVQNNGDFVAQCESNGAPVPAVFDNYMERAHHLLQRPAVPLDAPQRSGDSGDSRDSLSWIKTELSPVSSLPESTEQEEPTKDSAVSSLRFTTLRA